MKKYLILISLFTFCVGCNDFAARQQQAEEERTQQVIKDLKKLGNEMHSKPPADSTAKDTPETKPDSPQDNIESSE